MLASVLFLLTKTGSVEAFDQLLGSVLKEEGASMSYRIKEASGLETNWQINLAFPNKFAAKSSRRWFFTDGETYTLFVPGSETYSTKKISPLELKFELRRAEYMLPYLLLFQKEEWRSSVKSISGQGGLSGAAVTIAKRFIVSTYFDQEKNLKSARVRDTRENRSISIDEIKINLKKAEFTNVRIQARR